MTTARPLPRFPLHLGRGARAVPQPEFTGLAWYDAYVERAAADGDADWLVQQYGFDAPWTSWERHPAGDETVICLSGEITLIQELPDGNHAVVLRPGDYAINPRGVWHTADTSGPVSALFTTAGRGTEHRTR